MTSEIRPVDGRLTCFGCSKHCGFQINKPWNLTVEVNCPKPDLASELRDRAGQASLDMDPNPEIHVVELGSNE